MKVAVVGLAARAGVVLDREVDAGAALGVVFVEQVAQRVVEVLFGAHPEGEGEVARADIEGRGGGDLDAARAAVEERAIAAEAHAMGGAVIACAGNILGVFEQRPVAGEPGIGGGGRRVNAENHSGDDGGKGDNAGAEELHGWRKRRGNRMPKGRRKNLG